MNLHPFCRLAIALIATGCGLLQSSHAQSISITNTNTASPVQTFDSLGTFTLTNIISGTNGVPTSLGAVVSTNLNGWYAAKIAGTGTNAFYPITANNGSSTTGGIHNYGATNAPDNTNRSLGVLASATVIGGFGALLQNDTTNLLTALNISMTAKFWRSSTSVTNVLTFAYGVVDGTNVTTSNFLITTNSTPLPAMNVVGPAPVATNGPLDGNNITNQVQFSNVAIPIGLAPGQSIFIRWQDANDAGSDAGLAIDDFSFSAEAAPLAAPQFDIPPGTYLTSQTVKISNYASYPAGAEVRYTLDGGTPGPASTLYDDNVGILLADGNGPIVLKAIALEPVQDWASLVSSGTYNLPENVANLSALRASPADGTTIYRVTGQATFTAGTSFRNTKFFQDSAAGIQIDDNTGIITTIYTAGDNIQNFMGRTSVFNGQLQMVPVQDFGAPVSTGNTVTPLTRTIATLTNADQAMLVTIEDVEFQSAGLIFGAGGFNTNIRDVVAGPYNGVMRNIFGESNVTGAVIPAGPNTLTGVVQSGLVSSQLTLAVGPRNLADIVFTGTPTLYLNSSKLTLNAGGTGPSEEATVQILRSGDLSQAAVVDLSQDVADTFAADVNNSFTYTPLPTNVTIPANVASVLIYVVALPNTASFSASFIASAVDYAQASQSFFIQGTGGGFTSWVAGGPTNSTTVGKYAIGGATSPTANDGIPSVTTVTSSNLSITAIVRTNDPSLTVVGQATTNLVSGPWLTNGVTTTVSTNQNGVPSGTERQIFSTPTGSATNLFLRLRSTLQP